MSERRLIGIDLAWGTADGGEPKHSGCAELVWDGKELELTRVDWIHSIDDIVDWIKPGCDEWVVAVDAPLVIRNETRQRIADKQASKLYTRPYQAGAHSANLNGLGKNHRGGQLLKRLERRDGTLVEEYTVLKEQKKQKKRRLVFETYPHIVMVELFDLPCTIKYKNGSKGKRSAGQRQLTDAIREHLCSGSANPCLRINDNLKDLLREPKQIPPHAVLDEREGNLDALICAYMAAWLDKGRPVRGLGEVCEGVMITPHLLGVGLPLG